MTKEAFDRHFCSRSILPDRHHDDYDDHDNCDDHDDCDDHDHYDDHDYCDYRDYCNDHDVMLCGGYFLLRLKEAFTQTQLIAAFHRKQFL